VLKKFDGDLLSIENCHVEFGKSLFFRNKACYIIGRLIDDDDKRSVPFALPILNDDQTQSRSRIWLPCFRFHHEQLLE
jgi:isocitrate dehydrogenase kinase/phosphatase